MKKLFIIIGCLFGIQASAQTLHVEGDAVLSIEEPNSINNQKELTPTLFIDGDVINNGTINNNGEIQFNANLTNNGTYTTTGDDVFVRTGEQTLFGNFLGANRFNNLILDKGDSLLVLGSNIEVQNNINLIAGVLKGNGFRTHLLNTSPGGVQSTAASGSMTNFIDGLLRQNIAAGTYTFYVGDSAFGNQRVSIDFTNTGGATYIDVSFTSAGAGPTSISGCNAIYDKQSGTWTLTPNGVNGTYDYAITLDAGGANLAAYSPSAYDGIMKDGVFITNPCAQISGNNTVSGLDSFSSFKKVSTTNIALPVELMSFSGKQLGEMHKLFWTTATEINSSHFGLQRSQDGIRFEQLSLIPTQALNGNSTAPLHYSYDDQEPYLGHNYYRLELVDINGNKTYSNIIDLVRLQGESFRLYPNPSTDYVHLDYSLREAGRTEVRLVDLSGRVIRTIRSTSHKGMNYTKIPLSDLADGIYHVQLLRNDVPIYNGKVRKN